MTSIPGGARPYFRAVSAAGREEERMRVITGSARGRRLKTLEGLETRPTSERVKEGVFNILQFQIQGRRALDLFAGTGQMGIEALSRGADRAVFVDSRRQAAALVRENLAATGLGDRASVVCGEALAYLRSAGERFDMIFVDPPYAAGLWESVLSAISQFDILSDHGIIICESPAKQAMPERAGRCVRGWDYRYGTVKITLYHREEAL